MEINSTKSVQCDWLCLKWQDIPTRDKEKKNGSNEGSYGHWGGIDGFIPCTVTAGWLDIITEGSAWSAVTDFADICLWPAKT